jgi:hypothetical protein
MRKDVQAAALVVLFAVLLGASGCERRQEAQELAKAGKQTAETLATYYESLMQDTVDTWELQAFYSSVKGIWFDQESEEQLETRLEALQSRARMARRLAAAYGALLALSDYDASAEVKGAAEDLSGAVRELPPIKADAPDPTGIIGTLAGDLAAWKQSRDLREGSRLLQRALDRIYELYQREQEVCLSISRERSVLMGTVTEHLITEEKVDAWPLLERVPKEFGLQWLGRPTTSAERQGLANVVRARALRMELLSTAAAENTGQALAALRENHRGFQEKRGLSLESVLAGLEKAQTYLDDIAKLRKKKEE